MFKRTYILTALIFFVVWVQAQPTIIFSKAMEGDLLAGQMYIYEDESGIANINQVTDNPSNFAPNFKEVPHYTSTTSAIWVKANISVESDQPVFLKLGYPMMDTVQLFAIGKNGGVVSEKISGSLVSLDKRDLRGNYIKFQLKKGLHTYYIRVKSSYTLQLPIQLASYTTLYEDRFIENIVQGSYLGFAILIILYTFFLWVSLRDRVYIFYILHIIATAIITLHIGGYSYLLWWPNAQWINMFEPSIFGLGIFSTAFAIVFLETETKHKKLNYWLYGVLIANVLVFPLDWMGFHIIANKLVQMVGIIGCSIMLVGGVIAYKRGFKSARFFLMAWTVFLIGVITSILERVGVLPYEYYFVHASQIGSVLDMILLSFALADRINILQDEKELAKEVALKKISEKEELVRQQNALLSRRVEEHSREMQDQTETLGKQKEELEDLNTTKDKILSVIAHDLRGPLGNVSQLVNMMSDDKNLRNEETMGLLKDASKRSFDLLDSLLHWAKAQFGDAEYHPTKVNINSLANDTVQLYLLKAKAKDITIKNNIPEDVFANADVDMINTVIRNLISNALKFTIVGGSIILGGEISEDNTTVTVWVQDSGLGIANDKLDTIFDAGKNKSVKGTDGETGTGLGLVICKDFIEKNNGTIAVTSKLGQGSKFVITLPKYS